MKTITYLIISSLFLISCGGEQKPDSKPKYDSKIIHNESPEFQTGFWEISDKPVLVMGIENGDENLQFYRSRSGIKLEDDSFIITNSGTSEVRFYDSKGKFLQSTGQQGRGPNDFGEFSSMNIYRYTENTFAVDDGGNDRIQIFNYSGSLQSVKNVPKIEGFGLPRVRGIFDDGSWLLWSNVGSGALQGKPGSLIELNHAYHRLTPEWEYDRKIIEKPSRIRLVNETNGITNYPYIPFSSPPSFATDSKNHFLFTSGANAEIEQIDIEGNILNVFSWEFERIKVDDVWEDYKKESLESLRDRRKAQYANFYSQDLPLPEYVPAISELNVDRQGNIWAKRFKASNDGENIWDVLNAEGTWLGTLELPSRFSLTDIGEDYLFGYTYRNGFQQYELYQLKK